LPIYPWHKLGEEYILKAIQESGQSLATDSRILWHETGETGFVCAIAILTGYIGSTQILSQRSRQL
jgi:hypothetical protein